MSADISYIVCDQETGAEVRYMELREAFGSVPKPCVSWGHVLAMMEEYGEVVFDSTKNERSYYSITRE